MLIQRYLSGSLFLMVSLASLPGPAAEVAIAPKIGTTGLGADFVFRLSETLNVRLGGAAANLAPQLTFNDIEYDADIDLLTLNALLDWHAFRTPFRLSAGVYFNKNQYDLTSTPAHNIQIGDTVYTPAQVGTLNGHVEYRRAVSPYLGIGYNSAFTRDGHCGFYSDFGVFFTDSADVTLSTTQSAVSDTDLRTEEQHVQDALDKWKFYPVLNLGFYYRF